ncbi:hypothetical protein U1Q18_027264 [Sarracenia purpurea var. burkii]
MQRAQVMGIAEQFLIQCPILLWLGQSSHPVNGPLSSIQELADSSVAAVVVASSGDDEAIVASDLALVWKFTDSDAGNVSEPAVLRQHSNEHPKVPSILLLT